jgi:alkylated DNA repair protein alkB family protein 1
MADLMRDRFKYYKQKAPPPKLDRILDSDSIGRVIPINNELRDFKIEREFGLDISQCIASTLESCPGFCLVRKAFTPFGIRRWIKACVDDYMTYPNSRSNHPKSNSKLRWVTLGYHHDWDTKVSHSIISSSYSTFFVPRNIQKFLLNAIFFEFSSIK